MQDAKDIPRRSEEQETKPERLVGVPICLTNMLDARLAQKARRVSETSIKLNEASARKVTHVAEIAELTERLNQSQSMNNELQDILTEQNSVMAALLQMMGHMEKNK